MVFLDYTTVTITGNSSSAYTVPYRAFITADFNSGSRSTGSLVSYIARNDSNNNAVVKPLVVYTTLRTAALSESSVEYQKTYSVVFDAGNVIESANWGSVNATLHIFRLPEAP